MTLFNIDGTYYVSFDPGGKWHGWLWRKLDDGRLISHCKMELIEPTPNESHFGVLDSPQLLNDMGADGPRNVGRAIGITCFVLPFIWLWP